MWLNAKQESAQTSAIPAGHSDARKPSMKLNNLGPGSVITFSGDCTLPQLAGARAIIRKVRTYRFGADINISYALEVQGDTHYSLTIAEDAEGFYLALSRELDADEQDRWFGRDALSFFTEASTAKTIRCKADLAMEGDWAAPRYVKSVDWVEGSVLTGRLSTAQTGRQVKRFHYNLLVNETGDKALEIEHEDATGENRVLVTVYRPVEDIAGIAEPLPNVPVPPPINGLSKDMPKPSVIEPTAPIVEAPMLRTPFMPMPIAATPEAEPPLFAEPARPQQPHSRPDFRRRSAPEEAEPIFVLRDEIKPQPAMDAIIDSGMPPLPSFLIKRENSYLSLDEVIPPETERVRCSLAHARVLIEQALRRGVRVRDVMRELVGLDSALADEVVFEMPLTERDYQQLAMRYRVRPDSRDEIRRRLQQELAERLQNSIAPR